MRDLGVSGWILTGLVALCAATDRAGAQAFPPSLSAEWKFTPRAIAPLESSDAWGRSLAHLGDLDGDGRLEVAIGVPGDDGAGGLHAQRGAVWIATLDAAGRPVPQVRISERSGGFDGTLGDLDLFGTSVAPLGDLDGDGVTDLAVGAVGDDDGGPNRGAVWILTMNADGTVREHDRISSSTPAFAGELDDYGIFGSAVAGPGDLDGDGVVDLVAGAQWDDEAGSQTGAIWLVFLKADGGVKTHVKLSGADGTGLPTWDEAEFGRAIAALGDLDGDGDVELAVGAPERAPGVGQGPGNSVFVFSVDAAGLVPPVVHITEDQAGFGGQLDVSDEFGSALCNLGDVDDDGVDDLAVGAAHDWDDATPVDAQGAVWVLLMEPDGTVASAHKFNEVLGGFAGPLAVADDFGQAVAPVDPRPGATCTGLLVGTPGDDSFAEQGKFQTGAIWSLLLADESAWEAVGGGVAGRDGLPQLTDSAGPCPGQPFELAFDAREPSALAWLVHGVTSLGAPWLGGTLVPDPTPPGGILFTPSDALGLVTLAGDWPETVPPGIGLWVQLWVRDETGPQGMTASDGYHAVTP